MTNCTISGVPRKNQIYRLAITRKGNTFDILASAARMPRMTPSNWAMIEMPMVSQRPLMMLPFGLTMERQVMSH